MKNMTLENIAKAAKGTLFACDEMKNTTIAGVVLDSRKVEKDYLFIATKGEKVDGHSFIPSVFEKGALAVVCEKAPEDTSKPYILVEDSFQALKDIATFYREQLDIKVVGITGSVGKTSTKEFIAGTLATHYEVLKTEGNFNNEVGLPLTVLRIRDNVEVAVLEMGISEFGEMHRLSQIAKPDICVITNIGQCHLENLGTRDGILKAKSEIFDFMNPNGFICVNGEDDKLATLTSVKGITPMRFGEEESNQVFATDIVNRGLDGSDVCIHIHDQSIQVHVPLPGKHMILNAMAATLVGDILGLSTEEIARGIASVEPVSGRSHIIKAKDITIIDDCYNANPVSMKAAIDLLKMANTRKVAMLGDMFELGTNEVALHGEVGAYAAQEKMDVIICIGNLSKALYEQACEHALNKNNVYYFNDLASFKQEMKQILKPEDTILCKASHGMHFETVLPDLEKLFVS